MSHTHQTPDRVDKTRDTFPLAVLVLASLCALAAHAAARLPDERLAELRSGSLMLALPGSDEHEPAPLLDTRVSVQITGPIARVRVAQVFANSGEEWAEGLYVFPLPDQAAVDRLRMHTADRVIEGQIREKQEARREYEAARAEGRRASLVSQQRPNVFTSLIANLGPGEEITIEIEYQQPVEREGDVHLLRFPLTVAPRFEPGPGESLSREPSAPAAGSDTSLRRPAQVSIDLAPGFPLEQLRALYHDVRIEQRGDRYAIELAQDSVPANRDFVLRWQAQPEAAPRAVLFGERVDDADYALLMLSPPESGVAELPRVGRELIFVIDTSGSMNGASMRQARSALWLAIEALAPDDRFNVIRFSDSASSLFPTAQVPSTENLEHARAFVNEMNAGGGTRMLPALSLALTLSPGDLGGVRQIVFLTDGAVGNEDVLFRAIQTGLGDSRLFTIGIGSAPNTHFMRRAAEFGRGSFTHIGDSSEVAEATHALFRKLAGVSLSDIRVELSDGQEAEILPGRLPDLYSGESLVLALRAPRLSGYVHVSGWSGDVRWEQTVELRDGESRGGIGALWARRRITELIDVQRLARKQERRDELRGEIVDVALAHHLVSPYTSLVAVDVTPARRDWERLAAHRMKSPLPSREEGSFALARTASEAPFLLIVGALLIVASGFVFGLALRSEAP